MKKCLFFGIVFFVLFGSRLIANSEHSCMNTFRTKSFIVSDGCTDAGAVYSFFCKGKILLSDNEKLVGDTIIGFNFLDNTDIEFNADFGLTSNMGFNISATDTSSVERTLTYTTGSTNYAATADGWNEGANSKSWSIEFNADGYSNLKLYSKQRSGGSNPGPKNWKIQVRLGSGAWEDVANGTVIVGNDWITGEVAELPLPASIDNPGTTSVYVRWIMIDNEDSNGGTVSALGISKIDDIMVIGQNVSGNEVVVAENVVSFYPNPCSGTVNISSVEEIAKIEMCDLQGQIIFTTNSKSTKEGIHLDGFAKGIYIVKVFLGNKAIPVLRKIIVN
jgi:hypothetical protein